LFPVKLLNFAALADKHNPRLSGGYILSYPPEGETYNERAER